jgi:amino-acid N-acetyltransferase
LTGLLVHEVTQATHGDLPFVLALLSHCELPETGVAEAIDGFCIARSVGALVGCAGLEAHGELGLLRSVAVDVTARNAGLGALLVESVVASARARRLRELYLLTTTAARFFERRGFASVLRSSVPPAIANCWEFRVGCPETALAMRLPVKEA